MDQGALQLKFRVDDTNAAEMNDVSGATTIHIYGICRC